MRTTSLGGVLSAAVAIAACFVDRPSESLECSTTDDCAALADNRQCQSGYCVVPNCPDDCTSCDENARTCNVDCTTDERCADTITCPSGWTCTITCTGDNACDDVQCNSGSRCDIACSGTGACEQIDCDNACQCDLACAAGACNGFSCPTRGNGANQVTCTEDGTTATPCDSARAASCAGC